MILATLRGGGPDGTLVVVSPDRARFALPDDGPRTLQEALDRWDACESALEACFERLASTSDGLPTSSAVFAAPLPRSYHWAEGSCYLPHMERIRGSRGEALPAEHRSRPKVYQGGSDQHLAPVSEFRLLDPEWELDLEATIVVFAGAVAAGVDAVEAAERIRLVGLTNDLTYRALIVEERQEGSGIYHSKPGRAYAPYVVTPSTLGSLWSGTTLHARVRTEINGDVLGEPFADRDLSFDFGRIMEHLCRTRALTPGSIVGTGTVSNADPVTGIGCIAEKRAMEIETSGRPTTRYLQPGDALSIETFGADGVSLFGAIEQTVIRAD